MKTNGLIPTYEQRMHLSPNTKIRIIFLRENWLFIRHSSGHMDTKITYVSYGYLVKQICLGEVYSEVSIRLWSWWWVYLTFTTSHSHLTTSVLTRDQSPRDEWDITRGRSLWGTNWEKVLHQKLKIEMGMIRNRNILTPLHQQQKTLVSECPLNLLNLNFSLEKVKYLHVITQYANTHKIS